MNSGEVLYSKGKNDECYTPSYAVKPILKYIPKHFKVWCPFDKNVSEFVKLIKENGNEVIYSHIDLGKDFFNYEPKEHWDCIISNTPFTNKRKIFERALSFNKQFALMMSCTWLNDSAPSKLFMKKKLEVLMFDKRIKFLNNGVVENKITFATAYFCHDFLPNQIIFEELLYV